MKRFLLSIFLCALLFCAIYIPLRAEVNTQTTGETDRRPIFSYRMSGTNELQIDLLGTVVCLDLSRTEAVLTRLRQGTEQILNTIPQSVIDGLYAYGNNVVRMLELFLPQKIRESIREKFAPAPYVPNCCSA